jgi:DNA-binding CsgD family transcriptional regulator
MLPPMPHSMSSGPAPEDLNFRLSETLHAIALSVLLVDSRAMLLYANHAGQASLHSRSGLVLRCGNICAIEPMQQAQLEQAISAAARGQRSLVHVGQATERRLVAVLPLGGDVAIANPTVLLLSGQCDPPEPIALTLFARTAGLTPSEREVLIALCEGVPPQEIARQRSVSLATVRTQIGAIRTKVGARTIAHVVRKVSTLPPMTPCRARVPDFHHLLLDRSASAHGARSPARPPR